MNNTYKRNNPLYIIDNKVYVNWWPIHCATLQILRCIKCNITSKNTWIKYGTWYRRDASNACNQPKPSQQEICNIICWIFSNNFLPQVPDLRNWVSHVSLPIFENVRTEEEPLFIHDICFSFSFGEKFIISPRSFFDISRWLRYACFCKLLDVSCCKGFIIFPHKGKY